MLEQPPTHTFSSSNKFFISLVYECDIFFTVKHPNVEARVLFQTRVENFPRMPLADEQCDCTIVRDFCGLVPICPISDSLRQNADEFLMKFYRDRLLYCSLEAD